MRLKRSYLAALLLAVALPASAQRSRVAIVGDPQVDSEEELVYAQRSAFRELRERRDLDLVVFLGDLVNDKPELLGAVRESLDSLGTPWVCCVGNHDRDVYSRRGERASQRTRDAVSFAKIVGPEDTSFVFRGVRYIIMNDVRSDRGGYEAGFLERQKEWLAGVVSEAGREPVIFATHIPVTEMETDGGLDSLRTILSPLGSRILFCCAHTHTIFRRSLDGFGSGAAEVLDAGTVCGSWWRGFKDSSGIPAATMNCGSPRGYFVADFLPRKKAWHRLAFKRVGAAPDDQLSAFINPANNLLTVNVFGGHKDGVLKARIDGRWITLTRTDFPAPEAMKLKARYDSLGREWRRSHPSEFIPILGHASPHVWTLRNAPVEPGDIIRFSYSDYSMDYSARVTVQK